MIEYVKSDEDDEVTHEIALYNNLAWPALSFLIFVLIIFQIKRLEMIEKIIQKSPILMAMNNASRPNGNNSFDSLDCGVYNCENIDEVSTEM